MDAAGRDADEALIALYTTHYRSLVRLSTLLLHDQARGRGRRTGRLRRHARLVAPARATPRRRSPTCGRPWSTGRGRRLRHLKVADRKAPALLSADATHRCRAPSTARWRRWSASASCARCARCPIRQREVLVLRYYADLSEAQIAEAMGISTGAVKSHASRGMGALRERLEQSS